MLETELTYLQSDTSSAASFEKALSKLSGQISSANASLETTRSHGRRWKALLTLYTTIAYLIFTLVLTLVLGPNQWSIPHYGGLIGAPVVIYGARRLLTLFFDWRTSRQQSYLDNLQQQRETKITELKKATKYDSTQELLQKYGAGPRQTPTKQTPQSGGKKASSPSQPQVRRTGIAPPATANIQPQGRMSPSTPQGLSNSPTYNSVRQPLLSSGTHSPVSPDQPGFAPNAFTGPSTTSVYIPESHWYDRILDVLLGEDETLVKNRLALICSKCRQVNGQAPPGIKTLEELGRWRCVSCGSWNGVENEATKVVQEMAEKMTAVPDPPASPVLETGQRHRSDDMTDEDGEEGHHDKSAPRDEIQDSEDDSEKENTTDSKRFTRSSAKQIANEVED